MGRGLFHPSSHFIRGRHSALRRPAGAHGEGRPRFQNSHACDSRTRFARTKRLDFRQRHQLRTAWPPSPPPCASACPSAPPAQAAGAHPWRFRRRVWRRGGAGRAWLAEEPLITESWRGRMHRPLVRARAASLRLCTSVSHASSSCSRASATCARFAAPSAVAPLRCVSSPQRPADKQALSRAEPPSPAHAPAPHPFLSAQRCHPEGWLRARALRARHEGAAPESPKLAPSYSRLSARPAPGEREHGRVCAAGWRCGGDLGGCQHLLHHHPRCAFSRSSPLSAPSHASLRAWPSDSCCCAWRLPSRSNQQTI